MKNLIKIFFSVSGSAARVSLSELRVPLMWRDSDHFKNRGDYRRFAVFCLARVGTEIHDTALICPVDRAQTDITFPDVLLLWVFYIYKYKYRKKALKFLSLTFWSQKVDSFIIFFENKNFFNLIACPEHRRIIDFFFF